MSESKEETSLPQEISQQISTLKTKLFSQYQDIKTITDQGRLIAHDASQLFLFRGMFMSLKSYFDNFQTLWDRIIDIVVAHGATKLFPSDKEKQLMTTVKKYYYECCAIHQLHTNPPPSSAPTEASQRTSTLNDSRTVRARLPQINLPMFSGVQAEWPLFRDTYRSLIHDEPTLSEIEKFLFLVSCLKGSALTLVKGVELTEDNYQQAWKLLTDTYNDKRRLANSYLRTVLTFVPFKTRPSASSLKNFLTTVGESIDSFRQLKIPNADDFILFCLMLRCLDPDTRTSFEKKHSKEEFPSYQSLRDFIKTEWRSLELTAGEFERPSPNRSNSQNYGSRQVDPTNKNNHRYKNSFLVEQPKNNFPRQTPTNRFAETRGAHGFSCPVCRSSHTLYQCSKFKNLSPVDRVKALQGWNGCTNCLSSRHTKASCLSQRRCLTCSANHHSWLHTQQPQEHTPTQGNSLGGLSSKGEVLLGTAVIDIMTSSGSFIKVRAVTDSGSQYSFITEDCAQRLGLPVNPSTPNICGVGQSPLRGTKGRITCRIRSTLTSNHQSNFFSDAIVVQNITGNLPHTILSTAYRERYKSYVLADEEFWKPGPVEFLIGGDLFYDLITGRPLVIDPSIPRLLPSALGFIIAGPTKLSSSQSQASSLFVNTTEDLKDILVRFWEIEKVIEKPIISEEEKHCETHFKSTYYKTASGRYVVSLPTKESISSLADPRKQALSRLLNLEAKLAKDDNLRREYHNFMSEYLKLGHMKLAPANSGAYTIPHHPVVKYKNRELKLRVVFDASCKTINGSLNDHLFTGPKLQQDISDILSNFRIHLIAFTADIVKMFRQILVNPSDRKFQHILWRFSTTDDIQEYELCTVTYGERPSPYLAQRAIRQLVLDKGDKFPLAAKVLLEDIFVDDIPTGASSISDALHLQDELIGLLGEGGFQLSKWASNCPDILERVTTPEVTHEPVSLITDEEAHIKLLGIQWNPKEDILSYEIWVPDYHPTKRAILSAIARMYDPLGYLSPVVFLAKTILQEMWLSKCGWDEIGPIKICNIWKTFLEQLNDISRIKIPRCITTSEDTYYSIIGFCDASQRGYAAALYLYVETIHGCRAHLLKAKTKLAPTKPLTIPRLELCEALLLARLFNSTMNFMKRLNIQNARFFTDAQIVLAWLSHPPEQLNIFVAHRVVEILELTRGHQWSYVSTTENPADCSSRGLMPAELLHDSLWWAGPKWLSQSISTWTTTFTPLSEGTLPELRRKNATVLAAFTHTHIHNWMQRFSSYQKLLRSLAYALRFIKRVRRKDILTGPISVQEMRDANKLCIRLTQEHYNSSFNVQESRTLQSLNPFQDKDGLLRVGGRLQQSSLLYDAKHPYIIPGKSHFAQLLVDFYHRTYLHLGPTGLQSILSCKYWIISARRLVRQRVFKCITCYKASRTPQAPMMGNLPSYRLLEDQVFTHVGVDLGGPFYIRESSRRKASLGKAYLCLFVCMSTKAVHLELVSKCSTDAFLAAFDRFIARRGKPSHVYSDCGTNFVGASNRLQKMFQLMKSKENQDNVIKHTSSLEIHWSFNPPSSPHFGGLWESGIKSAKSILYKIIGDTSLTFEELSTVFCKIEAILNSRPLVQIDSSSDSIECLTPGHFLIRKPLIAAPEDKPLTNATCLQRWKLVQQISHHFWTRWRLEYIHQLHQRRKWKKSSENLKTGDLVVIKEDHSPQRSWPLARIVDVHPGMDGIVRVATIRTSSGIYKRPIAKLVSLSPVICNNNM